MILAVVQARTSSHRLPGKVLADVEGEPMILRQLERLDRCRSLDRVVVATSDDPSDDALAALLIERGRDVHRGPLHDVLTRFAQAVERFGPQARAVVRLTADCPLIEPALVDAVAERLIESGADYCADDLVRTYPRGLDAEAFTLDALRTAAREATSAFDREHVTPFLYNDPKRFRLAEVRGERDLSHLRWTVDTPADLAFVRRVYAALLHVKPDFGLEDVLALPFERREADA